jgi:uncharacterized SAM-binding protein YcdF (DUF218 family)
VKQSPDWRSAAQGALAGAVAGFLLRDLGLFDAVSAWLPTAAVGALLGLWRKRAVLAAVLTSVFAVWLAAAFSPLAAWLCEGLTRRDDLTLEADAVVVLGSRLQSDGEPTATAESRLLHALDLTGELGVRRLVVTELPPPAASHTHLARALAARLPDEVEVVAVGPTRSTREEAVALGALVRARGFRHVILVTSPLHSLRGSLALEREGVVVASSPAVETSYDVETLDRPAERLLAFADAMHERVGLVYYGWRGWVPGPQGRP